MAEAMRAARRLTGPCSSGWILVAALTVPGLAAAAPTPAPTAGASAGSTGGVKPATTATPAKTGTASTTGSTAGAAPAKPGTTAGATPAKPATTPGTSTPTSPAAGTTAGTTATKPAGTNTSTAGASPAGTSASGTQEADEVGDSGDVNDSGDVPVIARAGLEVDTAAAGPSGPVMLSRLEELGNLELRRAEILPRRAGDDPVIRVKVEVRGEEGDTYAIFSEVTVRGQTLEGSAREVVCSLCTEGEAVERARSEMLRLVPFVRARFRAAPKRDTRDDKPAPTVAPPPDRRLGIYGKAGIGLLAGGAVLLGTGIGLAATEPRPDPDDPLREINLRPAGYAVLGVGAAAIVTGAVLLVLDRRKVRRVAHLAPMFGRGSAGLLLVGRF